MPEDPTHPLRAIEDAGPSAIDALGADGRAAIVTHFGAAGLQPARRLWPSLLARPITEGKASTNLLLVAIRIADHARQTGDASGTALLDALAKDLVPIQGRQLTLARQVRDIRGAIPHDEDWQALAPLFDDLIARQTGAAAEIGQQFALDYRVLFPAHQGARDLLEHQFMAAVNAPTMSTDHLYQCITLGLRAFTPDHPCPSEIAKMLGQRAAERRAYTPPGLAAAMKLATPEENQAFAMPVVEALLDGYRPSYTSEVLGWIETFPLAIFTPYPRPIAVWLIQHYRTRSGDDIIVPFLERAFTHPSHGLAIMRGFTPYSAWFPAPLLLKVVDVQASGAFSPIDDLPDAISWYARNGLEPRRFAEGMKSRNRPCADS
jgi:hypothetical protein